MALAPGPFDYQNVKMGKAFYTSFLLVFRLFWSVLSRFDPFLVVFDADFERAKMRLTTRARVVSAIFANRKIRTYSKPPAPPGDALSGTAGGYWVALAACPPVVLAGGAPRRPCFGPNGAAGCSHGFRVGRKAGGAQPVEEVCIG